MVCKGVTSIQKNAKHISHGIRVYDEAGNLIIAIGNVEYNCHHAVYELNEAVKLSESQKQQNLNLREMNLKSGRPIFWRT